MLEAKRAREKSSWWQYMACETETRATLVADFHRQSDRSGSGTGANETQPATHYILYRDSDSHVIYFSISVATKLRIKFLGIVNLL